VPLTVKELRPLRGAFGVLDREPPARHRQKERQAREPASGDAAQPSSTTVEAIWACHIRATLTAEVGSLGADQWHGGSSLSRHFTQIDELRPCS
jgi:hypothetical protein